MNQPLPPAETLHHQTPSPECEPWAAEYVEAMLSKCESDIYASTTLIEAAWENTPFEEIPEDVRTALHQALSIRSGVEWLDHANAYRVMWADTEEGVRYAAMLEGVDKLVARLREVVGREPFTEKAYIQIAKEMGVFQDGNADIGRFKRLVGFHRQVTWIDDKRMRLIPMETQADSAVTERTTHRDRRGPDAPTTARGKQFSRTTDRVTQDLGSLIGSELYEALMARTEATPEPSKPATKETKSSPAAAPSPVQEPTIAETSTALPFPVQVESKQVERAATKPSGPNPATLRQFLSARTPVVTTRVTKEEAADRMRTDGNKEARSPNDIELALCVELLQNRFADQTKPRIYTHAGIRSLTFAKRVSDTRQKIMATAVRADPRFNPYDDKHDYGLFVFVPESMSEVQKSEVLEAYLAGIEKARATASAVIKKASATGRFSREVSLSLHSALLIARDELSSPVKDIFSGAFIHFLSHNQDVAYDKATGVIARKSNKQSEREGKKRPWLAT